MTNFTCIHMTKKQPSAMTWLPVGFYALTSDRNIIEGSGVR
jgi:hypothetical protein